MFVCLSKGRAQAELLQTKASRRIFGSKKHYWDAGECCIMSLCTVTEYR